MRRSPKTSSSTKTSPNTTKTTRSTRSFPLEHFNVIGDIEREQQILLRELAKAIRLDRNDNVSIGAIKKRYRELNALKMRLIHAVR